MGASRLRVERRGKCRVMTKNEEARERPLLKARRFGTSASSVQALCDGKRRRFLLCFGKRYGVDFGIVVYGYEKDTAYVGSG